MPSRPCLADLRPPGCQPAPPPDNPGTPAGRPPATPAPPSSKSPKPSRKRRSRMRCLSGAWLRKADSSRAWATMAVHADTAISATWEGGGGEGIGAAWMDVRPACSRAAQCALRGSRRQQGQPGSTPQPTRHPHAASASPCDSRVPPAGLRGPAAHHEVRRGDVGGAQAKGLVPGLVSELLAAHTHQPEGPRLQDVGVQAWGGGAGGPPDSSVCSPKPETCAEITGD